MIEEKDGGPAFPGGYPPPGYPINWPAPVGMSLRDYFAAQAITASLYPSPDGTHFTDITETASACYEFADAMLAARKGDKS